MKEILRVEAARLGLCLTEAQLAQFETFGRALLEKIRS